MDRSESHMRANRGAILVVTGASGAGKTAAVACLRARNRPGLRYHRFDDVGVPAEDVMTRDFGSPEGWQLAMTHVWIDRLVADSRAGTIDLLDAQTRPSFVRAALAQTDAHPVQIVLLECRSSVRRRRLAERGQAELANKRMDAWAKYLHVEATRFGLPIIDTSNLEVDDAADALETVIATLGAR